MNHVIVAGPQAAGKSTVVKSVKKCCRNAKTSIEARDVILRKNRRKGGIYMTGWDEMDVMSYDFARMFKILSKIEDDVTIIDETNVFTLAHAAAHGLAPLNGLFAQYCELLEKLHSRVIFIDIPVEVSWERRVDDYKSRYLQESAEEVTKMLHQHRQYLSQLRPELLRIYNRLPIPKKKVSGLIPPQKVRESVLDFIDG